MSDQYTKFVVYKASIDTEIVYVGEGLNGRENHCKSGVSSVYGLNHALFNGIEIDLEVVGKFHTKEEAIQLEASLIYEKIPRFNKYCQKSKTRHSSVIAWYIETQMLHNSLSLPKQKLLKSILSSNYDQVVTAWKPDMVTHYLNKQMRKDELFVELFEYTYDYKKEYIRLSTAFINKAFTAYRGNQSSKITYEVVKDQEHNNGRKLRGCKTSRIELCRNSIRSLDSMLTLQTS